MSSLIAAPDSAADFAAVSATDSSLHRLIRTTRRRWAIRQTIEYIAIGFACGSAMAIALMMAQWMRSESSLSIALIVPSIGVLCGAALARRAIPTPIRVVNQVDQQTGDDDLLATAWQLRASADSWHQTIASLAEARCAHLRAADMIPKIIGKRGWSAITLSACTLSVLAAMSVVGIGTGSVAAPSSDSSVSDRQWNQWSKAVSAPTPAGASLPVPSPEAKAEADVDSRRFNEASPNPVSKADATHAIGAGEKSTGDGTGVGIGHTTVANRAVADWTQSADEFIAATARGRSTPSSIDDGSKSGADRPASDNSLNFPPESVPPTYRWLLGDYFAPSKN